MMTTVMICCDMIMSPQMAFLTPPRLPLASVDHHRDHDDNANDDEIDTKTVRSFIIRRTIFTF